MYISYCIDHILVLTFTCARQELDRKVADCSRRNQNLWIIETNKHGLDDEEALSKKRARWPLSNGKT